MRFTAEDFKVPIAASLRSFKTLEEICAEKANAKLHEWLKAAPVCYGRMFTEKDSMGHLHYWHSETGDKDHTHSARIVCIEPLTQPRKEKGET